MSLSPFLRLPLTDLTGCLINHQTYDKCGKFEMKMMDCLEAYGAERGKKQCADLVADFQECVSMEKQLLRFHVSFKSFVYVVKIVIYQIVLVFPICRPCETSATGNGWLESARGRNSSLSHHVWMLTKVLAVLGIIGK